MSSGTIVHLGADRTHRIPILKNAGYDIAPCDSLSHFKTTLTTTRPDAVLLSEAENITSSVVSTIRQWSPAPVIVFAADFNRQLADSRFELVIEEVTQPVVWLDSIRRLIEETRRSCAEYASTQRQSKTLTAESAELRQKSAQERKRSSDLRTK